MQQRLPRLQASQGATEAHKKLNVERNQLVALHTIKASEGAFSHRAHTVQAQRAHSARTALVIMLFILKKPLKTPNLHKRA